MSAYETSRYLSLDKPIVEAKYFNDTLFIITNEHVLYIFDDNYILKSKTKLLKNQEERHIYCNAYSVTHNSISVPLEKTLLVVSYTDQKIVPKFQKKIYDLGIVFTEFCNKGEYLVSAAQDGKVHVIDTKTKAIRYCFANEADYCSYAKFSRHRIFLFVGYFNGENTILNLTNDRIYRFKTEHPIECAKFFDEDRKLFLCDREGNSILYDCVDFEIVCKNALFNEWVTCAVLSPNEKFIIAGTRKNKLYIIDPYTNQIVRTVEFEEEGITSISIYDSNLLLGFANATVRSIDLAYKKNDFSVHVHLKEYAKAKEMLDKNVFLYIDDDIIRFEEGFEEVIQKAKELIAKGRIDEALEIVSPFMEYKKFKHRVDLLFMQQDHIAKFIEAVEVNNIEEAYAIAGKYSVITTLSYYENLEKQWISTFHQARKIIEDDPLRGKAKAEQLLSMYKSIPQKAECVKQLINHTSKFEQADRLVKNQDFDGYFKLVSNYAFLQDTALYKKIKSLAESIYTKTLNNFANKQFESAQNGYKQLLHFPFYKKIAQKELIKINAIIELEAAISKDDKKKVYALLQQVDCIGFIDSFMNYNQTFENLIQAAIQRAQSGRMADAISLVSEYIELPVLKNKIDNCMKLGYLFELKQAEIDQKDVEPIVSRYKALFGLDEDIRNIFIQKGHRSEYDALAKSTKVMLVKPYPVSLLSS